MTPLELLREAKAQNAQGLPFMILTIPRRRRTGHRVQVLPGVLGHVVGGDLDRFVVSVQIRDVLRCLEKVMGVRDGAA